MGEDITHAQERLKHHVTHAADMLPGGPAIIQQVEAHPVAAIVSGLGLGVAAGMMGGGGGDNGSRRDGYGRDGNNDRYSGGDSSGIAGGAAMMLGGLTNSLIAPLRPYVEDAAKQVIAGFADRQRSSRDSMPDSTSTSAPRGNPTAGPADSPRWGDVREPAPGSRSESAG